VVRIEKVVGSNQNDTLYASDINNRISFQEMANTYNLVGGGGDDKLFACGEKLNPGQNTELFGGAGNDALSADITKDNRRHDLWGGSGSDTFILTGDLKQAEAISSKAAQIAFDFFRNIIPATLSLIPVVGLFLSYAGTLLNQTINAVNAAGNTPESMPNDDLVHINDFTLGEDVITLPKLNGDPSYRISMPSGMNNRFFIEVKGSNETDFHNIAQVEVTNPLEGVSNARNLDWFLSNSFSVTKGDYTIGDVVKIDNSKDESTNLSIYGNNTNDEIQGGKGNNEIQGFGGDDTLTGGAVNDTLRGGDGNDTLNAGAGNDILNGGAGDDILNPGYSEGSTDTVNGGDGNDLLQVDYTSKTDGGIHVGLYNTNNIWNRAGGQILVTVSNVENDNITGTQYDDVFEGNPGNDTFNGGAGNDILNGGDGQLFSKISISSVVGGFSTDQKYLSLDANGDGLNDIIQIYNNYGTATAASKKNNGDGTFSGLKDVGIGGFSADQKYLSLDANSDGRNDIIQIWNKNGTAIASPKINQGNGDFTWGGDYEIGGFSADQKYLSLDANGDGRNDIIQIYNKNGTAYTNVYSGNGAGNDLLTGGLGKDTLTGGLGADRFDYRNLADSVFNTFDVITDFNATAGNDLFVVSTARTGFNNVGTVATLDTTGITAKLTNTTFAANAAAQFSFGSRTFVGINDTIAGFDPTKDAIIEVTGLAGTLGLNNFTTTLA
jgi:Ca2+-binding RTX toxin-like protein